MVLLIILAIVLIVILGSLKQINEYERGVKFTAGKFTKIMLPGWRIVLPIFQSYKKVDIRTKVDDVPEQEAITKDNVSVKINAVIYYKVFDASLAVLQVEDFYYATAQLAQTTMRNIVGSVTLDELLCEREKVSSQIKEIIDKETDPWGIKVENVELKDISLTDEMKRVIARAAEAEREKQAVITKSIGEKEAAENLADAARKLAESPGALHLRTLETINDVSSDQSNTIFFPIPMDVLEAVKGYSEKLKKENKKVFVIHRLDYDTSGVIMFAKNQKVQKLYQDNWNNLAKTREYIAVVEGRTNSKGHIESYLKMSKSLQVYSSKNKDGLFSITDYERITYNDKYSLLRILISTGRRNQIRCHMSDIGHPILGDTRYKSKTTPLNRLTLHASLLEITNPLNNKVMTFKSNIPKEFYEITK